MRTQETTNKVADFMMQNLINDFYAFLCELFCLVRAEYFLITIVCIYTWRHTKIFCILSNYIRIIFDQINCAIKGQNKNVYLYYYLISEFPDLSFSL